jgi:hypothetical protein
MVPGPVAYVAGIGIDFEVEVLSKAGHSERSMVGQGTLSQTLHAGCRLHLDCFVAALLAMTLYSAAETSGTSRTS